LPKLAARLCAVEADWERNPSSGEGANDLSSEPNDADPFGQLDLLLQEIRDDSVS